MTTTTDTTTTHQNQQQKPQTSKQARRGSKEDAAAATSSSSSDNNKQQQPAQIEYRTSREELERDLNAQLSQFVYMSSNGGDSKELAEKLTDVGLAFRALAKHRSELRYMQKALEMRKRILDGDQMEIADSLLNLGIAYAHNGEPKYELRYKLEALRMYKRLKDDEDHVSLAEALYQVGLAYRYLFMLFLVWFRDNLAILNGLMTVFFKKIKFFSTKNVLFDFNNVFNRI